VALGPRFSSESVTP